MSVDDVIDDIESRTDQVFFDNFETVPVEILTEVAPTIAPRFVDSFLKTTREGIHCGELLIDGQYGGFRPANLSHREAEHKTQIYNKAFYSIEERGVDLASLGHVVQAINLFRRYLHDHGSHVSSVMYMIDRKDLNEEAVKEELQKLGRHFIYLNRHVASELNGRHDFEDFDLAFVCDDAASFAGLKNPMCSDCKFEGQSLTLNGDPNSVYVAILNLCKNGIAYGKQSVRVGVSKEDEFAVVTVVDKGEGIPQDQWSSIRQEGVSYKGSSGLGLAIVSDAIEKTHGGRIEFGKGTVFPYNGAEVRLYLPLRHQAFAPLE
ncbi:MAG: ATP-binding protein [Nanoarchaeota archaeon]